MTTTPSTDGLKERTQALRDAIGLCESEAARWQGDKTGAHWRKVANILIAEFFPDEIINRAKAAVMPTIARERSGESVGQGVLDVQLR